MKLKRQAKIIEIIQNHDIETQVELVSKLHDSGYNVTQATASRDIRDLKLTKVLSTDGFYKYAIFDAQYEINLSDRLLKIIKEAIVCVEHAQNMVVIKTLEGMAMAVASSIDAMHNPTIVGTIAGDDTIFCVIKTEHLAAHFINHLNDIVK